MTALERSDAELLAAIAQQDREAFAELYDRHSQAAFSLSLNLTHNRALAEDSLQDAMLTVWKDAAQCRAENVRGWILQIIANKSLRNGRVLRSGKQREKRVGELRPVNTVFDGAPENSELFAALQGKLGTLPSLDRQLIAMHFGAGMTQYEISSALSIPRTTIASRIEKVLGLLRGSLSQAGFAGVPIADLMHQLPALSLQERAPALLRAKVLAKCGGLVSRKMRSVKRTQPAASASHLPVLVAASLGFA
jgi:RNA polymerase sigma-70 factor (ECF subfamily)